MARKPPDWRQPSLFTFDPAKTPEPQDNTTLEPDGDQHAVQDDHSRTPATTAGDARAAAQGAEAPAGTGTLRQGTEDQPRGVEGSPLPGDAEKRPEPDSERGPGNGSEGSGGSFALRVSGRQHAAVPRRGNGVHPP